MSVPSALMKQPPIQSTAGAVPVRNEKGTVLSCFSVPSYLFPSILQTYLGPTTLTPQTLKTLLPLSFSFPIKFAADRVTYLISFL